MAEVKAAGAIVYFQEGKHTLFLLLRSASHGGWGAPKGHAEPGETELETAARELFEEAGLRLATFTPHFRETITYNVEKEKQGKTCAKEVVYFLCKIDSDQIRLSDEHSEAHFATLDEVEVMVTHEEMKEIFRKAHEFIRKGE